MSVVNNIKLNVLFIFFITKFYGQDAKMSSWWYFGNGVKIQFSSSGIIAHNDGNLFSYESSSSISDTLGNLIFYTDGDTVWTKNGTIMPNGTGLLGCGNFGGSSLHGSLIIPKPKNDSLFYIFTTDCFENAGASGFRYSIVNMNLNGNLGAVISKNNLVFSPSVEALAATKHSNGKDYWLLTHEFGNNKFVAFKLDSVGLDLTPVISNIGLPVNDFIVSIVFSPNGKKIAMTNTTIYQIDQLFDFNSSNGTVTNVINLSDGYLAGSSYDAAFSPDNSKLYFMSSGSYVYQYCLNTAQDSASISSTNSLIAFNIDNSTFGQLQNAPDGKIYIASQYNDSISIIDNPNFYGSLCNFQTKQLALNGKFSTLGLPNFPASYFYDPNISVQGCDPLNNIPYTNKKNDLVEVSYNNLTKELAVRNWSNQILHLSVNSLTGSNCLESMIKETEEYLKLDELSEGVYIVHIKGNGIHYYKKIKI